MKIGKYEFDSEEQAQELIDALGIAIDEEGNTYPTHREGIAHLRFITLQQGVYDENGNVISEPIFADKYSVDVLWSEEEHADWAPFRIEVEGEGSHGFAGVSYQKNKVC